jgi:signal transduction histidine kinase
VGNALKCSRKDAPPEVKVKVETHKSRGEFHIHVKDNGIGIPEEYHMKIFRPLERGPFREQSGFGIGLATCQQIVERHRGRILVKSEVGVGSTFTFPLPIKSNG